MKLKEQLLKYLQEHEGWVASGDLQRIDWPKYAYRERRGSYTPQTMGRSLRLMAEAGEIFVEYRKNHAWYSAKQMVKRRSHVELRDGKAYEVWI